jgi:hypothetical protein
MAVPFVIVLTALVYLKPQELVPALQALPVLHFVFGLAVLAVFFDVAQNAVRGRLPPQTPWVAAFGAWAFVDILVRDRTSVPHFLATIGIGVGTYFVVAIGMGSAGRVWTIAVLLLGLAAFLATIGVHQSAQPFACFSLDRDDPDNDSAQYDGHPCTTFRDCEEQTGQTDVDWVCEKPGMLGTWSIAHGRVRYRGSLADPNELALVIGTAVPFAFAMRERRRGALRTLLAVAAVALTAWCVVETQSRGGQLVFLIVVGLFFLRRFRVWGVAVAIAVALPVLLLGGRAGAEADASAHERIEAWYEGITLLREHPILGVGPGLFLDHHVLTAHNAYVLVAAETGIPGLFLWSTSIYTTIKAPFLLWWERDPRLERSLVPMAPALLFGLAGMCVGIFFLSFAYHYVLYLFIGLSGALANAARRTMPDFRVDVSGRELAWIAAVDAVFVVVMYVYTRAAVG